MERDVAGSRERMEAERQTELRRKDWLRPRGKGWVGWLRACIAIGVIIVGSVILFVVAIFYPFPDSLTIALRRQPERMRGEWTR
jgi:hypothetical protein